MKPPKFRLLTALLRRYRPDQPLVDPSHPAVYALYGAILVSGFQYLLEYQEAIAITETTGVLWARLWWISLIFGGLFSLWGVGMTTVASVDQRVGLGTEAVGCVFILATQGFYMGALVMAGSTANQTKTYAIAFGLAAALRLLTMPFEFAKVKHQTRLAVGAD